MKIRWACVLAIATICAWQLAHSEPSGFGGAQVTQFRTTSDEAAAVGCVANICTGFQVRSFDDVNGVMQGSVSVTIVDFSSPNPVQTIQCFGPEYANTLFLVQGNGDATVSATLDPSASGCNSRNVLAPVALSFTGWANGDSHISNRGSFTNDFGEQIFRGQFESERFTDTFDGTVGSFSGSLTGTVIATRNSQLEQVK